MIYCFGSSQVGVFSGTDIPSPVWPERSVICNGEIFDKKDALPWFRTFNIGAVLAYHAEKHFEKVKEILETISEFDKVNDTLLLLFGDVDIRMHVYVQAAKQKKQMSEIVKTIAKRYLKAVLDLMDDGFNIALYGCIGSAVRSDAPQYPIYGTVQNRNEATALFNGYLRRFCLDHNLPYVSVFNELMTEYASTDLRYMDTELMGKGNGLHITTKMLPLLLWKCRDIGLIPFEDKISMYE